MKSIYNKIFIFSFFLVILFDIIFYGLALKLYEIYKKQYEVFPYDIILILFFFVSLLISFIFIIKKWKYIKSNYHLLSIITFVIVSILYFLIVFININLHGEDIPLGRSFLFWHQSG
jgi:hypothetical protein